MKKLFSLLMICTLLMGLCTIGATAETKTVIESGSNWEYMIDAVDATAPSGWATKEDSATWETAPTPFSGKDFAPATAATIFELGEFECWTRKTFTVANASTVKDMSMSIFYDQCPIVYINGVEVWRWSEKEYNTPDAVDTVSLADKVSSLKNGENIIAVHFRNPVGGYGAGFDLSLSISESIVTTDANGYLLGSASCEGFADFGTTNAASNIQDGNQNTVCGSAWDANVTQSVTLTFKKATTINKVYVQCKDEGELRYENGARGTYDIYAIGTDGTETKIGSKIPAKTGTDGGFTLGLSTPVEASAVKVVITSWILKDDGSGDCWACVADLQVSEGTAAATGDTIPTDGYTVDTEWNSGTDTSTPSPSTGDAVVYATVAMAIALAAMVVVSKKVRA